MWPRELTVEVSTSNSQTLTQSIGLLCTSDQSVAQADTYTARNKHNRRIAMLSVGFKHATPAIKRLHNYKLDRTVNGDRRL